MRIISAAIRRRLASQEGFTMILALGVMVVATLIVAAVWVAVRGDIQLSQQDLDGKRAYYAASAGVNAYLYQLNQNPNYWETCANDTQTTASVPGATHGEENSYSAVPANGSTACTSDPISSLIDTSSGTLRVEFTGYSGNPQVERTIVASFRPNSPFDYLWYTVYEALDSSISGDSACGVWYRVSGGRPSACNINWITGDVINGPMYTQDQYLISGSPTFGRYASDSIASLASSICAGGSCGSATINGTPATNINVPLPANNQFLATDAADYGTVYSGTTSIVLSGTTATVTNCPSSCTTSTVNLTTSPIIYVNNASGCTPPTYSPYSTTYSTTGCSGDVYVEGNYTAPLTIAAANDIIINGSLTTTANGSGVPTGGATLGLIANAFVRVMHGCTSSGNVSGQTLTNPTIDAAILAIQHSFIVDNFNCGATLGHLTVNGALAQNFRGAVGTSSNGTISTGYLKSYTYDNRLAYLLPPYLFDISQANWHLARETQCTPNGGALASAC